MKMVIKKARLMQAVKKVMGQAWKPSDGQRFYPKHKDKPEQKFVSRDGRESKDNLKEAEDPQVDFSKKPNAMKETSLPDSGEQQEVKSEMDTIAQFIQSATEDQIRQIQNLIKYRGAGTVTKEQQNNDQDFGHDGQQVKRGDFGVM